MNSKNKMLFPKMYDFWLKSFLFFTKNKDFNEEILDLITVNDKQILDVGCKTGMMTCKIAKERPYSQIIGMENNQQFLRLAKKNKRQYFVTNVTFMNLANLELENKHFDVVLFFFAINDLPIDAIKELFTKVKSLLTKHKKLIIIDYNKWKSEKSNFVIKVLTKLFLHVSIDAFIKLDLLDLLQKTGYEQIHSEVFNGIKLISSINNQD